jgi:hypothetical protein
MGKEISAVIVTKTQNWIDKCLENAGLRLKDTAFVRTRKLGAKLLLYLILHRVYTSLQLELDDFYDGIGCAHVQNGILKPTILKHNVGFRLSMKANIFLYAF